MEEKFRVAMFGQKRLSTKADRYEGILYIPLQIFCFRL